MEIKDVSRIRKSIKVSFETKFIKQKAEFMETFEK